MASTKRRSHVWGLLVAVCAGLVLARLGPFDTFSDLSASQRTAYWVGLTLLLAIQTLAVDSLLRPKLPPAPLVTAAIAGIVASIPSAFEVAWAESLLRVTRDLGLSDLLAIYGNVAVIGVPLAIAMDAARIRPDPGSPLPHKIERNSLLAQLPQHKQGALLAFAAQDHYLRVFTDNGEALILHRFGDALADAKGLGGAQVHRSWWVAGRAVAGSERDRDRTFLILINGLRVPVSRSYLQSAREAGLL